MTTVQLMNLKKFASSIQFTRYLLWILSIFLLTGFSVSSHAQSTIGTPANSATFPGGNCTVLTPTFIIDFTGNPAGTWCGPYDGTTTGGVSRGGNCCGGTSSTCIRFIITIDAQADGISFNANVAGGCGAGTVKVD